MNDRLFRALASLVPYVASVGEVTDVGRGCISKAQRVSVCDESDITKTLFVKSNSEAFLSNFQCEWRGIELLSESGMIGVPTPIAVGCAEGRAWLVTQWVQQTPSGTDFFATFGRDLARHHQATLGDRIGLDHDNFLGAAVQVNTPQDSWTEFFAEHRIGYQLRWVQDQNLVDSQLKADCQKIINSMDNLLSGRDSGTSLLHGDLWSGNYLSVIDDADQKGEQAKTAAVLIDPAVYFGCREAEFGMLQLFGGCSQDFYQAYDAAFPLPGGWQRRVSVYVLYHLLNHLNLFGGGYLSQCQSLASQILRA